jgi:hypothetical protein
MLGIVRLFQGRFAEAVALEKEVIQQDEAGLPHVILAPREGYLGHADAAQAALRRYRSPTNVPVEDWALRHSREPAPLKLFLDGIALAEAITADRPAGVA